MSAVMNNDEKRTPVAASCSHANTKKAVRFGKKCAVCDRRVWKFWRARKCCDCKIVLHRSCVVAWEKYTARQAIVPYVVPAATSMVKSTEMKSADRVGDGIAPMYTTPRLWILANLTTVTVDCRRRATPLSVTVSHGYALTATMFRGLFDTSSVMVTAFAVVAPTRPAVEPAVKSLDARLQEAGDCDRTAARPGQADDVDRE